MVHANKNVSEYIDLLQMHTRVKLDKRDKNGRIVLVAKLGTTTLLSILILKAKLKEI